MRAYSVFIWSLSLSLASASPMSSLWKRLTNWGDEDVCAVDPRQRLHCPGAHLAVTQATCEKAGCCYDNTVWNRPWCFPNSTASVYEECDVTPAARMLCPGAYPGILHDACASLDCCYDDSLIGVPWCFPKKEDDYYQKCTIDQSDRRACPGAYPGITGTACASLDCCYDDSPGLSLQGVPWCYTYAAGY